MIGDNFATPQAPGRGVTIGESLQITGREWLDMVRTPREQAELKAELIAPFRFLRRFIYLAVLGSGSLGAFIFALKALAGKPNSLPNLGVQVVVVAIATGLWRWESQRHQRLVNRLNQWERRQ